MEVKIYTVPDCTWCTKAERLLKMANINDYQKFVVGEDCDLYFIQKEFPNNYGFPIIVVDGKTINGLIDLAKILIKEGLISSKINTNESAITDK